MHSKTLNIHSLHRSFCGTIPKSLVVKSLWSGPGSRSRSRKYPHCMPLRQSPWAGPLDAGPGENDHARFMGTGMCRFFVSVAFRLEGGLAAEEYRVFSASAQPFQRVPFHFLWPGRINGALPDAQP
jgi:hypothetical protein